MNRVNETESTTFVSLMCSLFPMDLHLELILYSMQLVLCRVAAVQVSPHTFIHRQGADCIFSGPLASLGIFWVSLKMEFR